ncbi:hypothetical protein OL229_04390 [Neisseriaceae bacterium JH1-16]|nr:hypothetical protein [Neisseriaceae bacterium JH1-16]
MRKRNWKSVRPSSLSEAFELCIEFAAEQRRTIKVLADLMGVEVKTLYRWLAEVSMPLNRVRQFEAFCGAAFVSEYLCLAHGNKVVIDIPAGKKAGVAELAEVQGNFAEAMALLVRFYEKSGALEETVSAISRTLAQLAYQRENVLKTSEPELSLFGDVL